ncbi:EAL domain-containing protein [Marinobacter sp.]|uniref:EAL domain-containing protein n=1 Tax=Marinobacter sp. TaxID=50741 RepID=UPI0035C6AA95
MQLHFADASTSLGQALAGQYSLPLVAVSVLVAIFAAFASVSHVDLMRASESPSAVRRWHLIGALAMGVGVWTMHFVGMVAFRLPIEVYFDPLPTLVSVLPAVLAGYAGLSVLRQPEPGARAIILGGTIMGAGIGVMHYVGMGGMIVDAQMVYQPGLFVASILVAVFMASLALIVPRAIKSLEARFPVRLSGGVFKLATAILMGLAISSLHYVAMAATVFIPADQPSVVGQFGENMDERLIVTLAVIASVFILVVSTLTVILRHRILALDALAARSEQEAQRIDNRFQKLVSRLPGMVYQFQIDADGHTHFPYASDAIESVLGVTAEDVRAGVSTVFGFVHHDDIVGLKASIRESADTLSAWKHKFRVKIDGEERWLQGNSIPERLGNGSVVWSGFINDITEQKRSEERIHQLAFFDELTGLPNRRLFEDRIDCALAASARHGQFGALLYIDLDDFKTLNDSLGHSFGDRLLIGLARLLTENLRECDTVARLGGDEFVIIANELGTTEESAARNAEKLAETLLRILGEPVNLGGYEYRCGASMGIVLFKGDDLSREELLKRADAAMYEAKSVGRSRVRFHDPGVQSILESRFRLEIELRRAIERQELTLVYQTQVGLAGQCEGVEALLRWHHPELGYIPPSDFIPIAEANGLILPLGQWVIDAACAQLARWSEDPELGSLILSVNVSSKQFHEPDFVVRVMETVGRHGINPARLCLEVTESMVLDDLDDALVKMTALRETGIRIAMDDFGTGYSSMAYLSSLPFDEVKIDKAFVQKAEHDVSRSEWVIIETIITLSHKLGMKVVAEGVETAEQHRLLSELGCDRFQGFYFGRPVDVDAFARGRVEAIVGR